MDKLQQITAYFCTKYPIQSELSKARLTKMVYLADWFSSLVQGKQLTDIKWVFNHYGPYVDDVFEAITRSRQNFHIKNELNIYGSEKHTIHFIGNEHDISLTTDEITILNTVINKTKSLYFNDFIDYVYSTYPIRSRTRYSILDLPKLAEEYKDSN
ncbi:Panacea domain-containing protein [Xenorhabdus szentirmaii]|uniref:Antitoxin SocA-like Panacea domain-containing protein n=2 Tax=Xenorhabdus szentirmaii TaxID=290112 RepID=W1J1V3_9GAMM|nr:MULTISPECIES: Panacea domain-containing protein [Xenorhabdus]MBD2792831.1 SocA family protein [Xenorhabdus sp. CUL]MBD2801019.1 SocA family protein [Xenorhabdus sp. M]MBD2803215.1 SocA family protein [Xenorhabdus sp. ZM]MBD2820298.1 SocA family protein [Xenorhabdus sp. 42]MBD2824418.1 SocA family protein [Xenorhabdus sp. 5]